MTTIALIVIACAVIGGALIFAGGYFLGRLTASGEILDEAHEAIEAAKRLRLEAERQLANAHAAREAAAEYLRAGQEQSIRIDQILTEHGK